MGGHQRGGRYEHEREDPERKPRPALAGPESGRGHDRRQESEATEGRAEQEILERHERRDRRVRGRQLRPRHASIRLELHRRVRARCHHADDPD